MNIFKQLILSLYSPRDIAKFRFQGIGKTILFVFILTLISTIPNVTYLSLAISNGVEAAQSVIKKDLPDFTIQDGQLQSDIEKPITISKDNFTILFDPTGALELNDLKNTENAIALLKNDFVLMAGSRTETYSYSLFNDMVITKNDFVSFVDTMESILAVFIPLMILVIYIFLCGVKFIEISILGLFGLMIKNMLGKNTSYRQLWRMAAYSVTLPTIFFTIMNALQTSVPNGFLINWVVSIIVLTLALREIPSPKAK